VTGCAVGFKVTVRVGSREAVGLDDGRNVGERDGYSDGFRVGVSLAIRSIPHSVIKNSIFSAWSMII